MEKEIPIFEGTFDKFQSLIALGEKIIEERKEN
jgi:hypothetical protein